MNSLNPELQLKNTESVIKNKLKNLLNQLTGFKCVITSVLKFIDSVTERSIKISKYKPLSGSSYNKLSKELNHSRKSFINIQNTDDNEYLKWCLARYLHH